MPVTIMGKLAVDQKFKGKGYGEWMLMDAIAKLLDSPIASAGLLVDAKEEAQAFSLRYSFIAFPHQPKRLLLPLATIRQLRR